MSVSHLSLLRTQVRHEAQIKYIGSIAGIYWALINPLIQVAMFVVVVTVIFKARLSAAESGRLDYAVFVLAGLSPWLAMQEGIISSAGSLVRHGDIVKNVVFPLELLPIAAVLVSFVSLTVSVTTLLVLALASGKALGASLVIFPILVVLQFGFTIGLGFLFAITTIFLRDLLYILPLLLQIATLLAPIAYSVNDMPAPLRVLTKINPVYYVIAGYRDVFFYGDWPSLGGLAYLAVTSVLLVVAGLLLFRRAKGYAEALI